MDTAIVLSVILSLFAFGGTFIILIKGYQSGKPTIEVIDSSVDFLDETLRDSELHTFLDTQVKQGKLDPKLANMVDVILGVARSTSPETASSARKKIAQLLDDMTDGDLNT